MARFDESRAALGTIVGAFVAFGLAFVLLGLVTPDITPRFQALCWKIAMTGFFTAAAAVCSYPGVWLPIVIRYWYSRLRQKAKPTRARAPAPAY